MNTLFVNDLSKMVRGYDFFPWVQITHCDQEIWNTFEGLVMLKVTLGLHSSEVGFALNCFWKYLEERLLM